MGKIDFVNRLAEGTDLATEPFPTQCLIEIYGDSRVLIENHLGISEYSRKTVSVFTKIGTVVISGLCLRIALMTKNRVVICGQIQSVTMSKEVR